MRATYEEARGEYLIFHTTLPGGEKLANPLKVSNLQMTQIPTPAGTTGETALLSFQRNNLQCIPTLEMTKGFKIELAGGGAAQSNGSVASEGGTSYWTPFLMGAMAGHMLSGNRSSGGTHVYYSNPTPPPQELSRKEGESAEKKSGFFSRNRSQTGPSSSTSGMTSYKRSGFFGRRR